MRNSIYFPVFLQQTMGLWFAIQRASQVTMILLPVTMLKKKFWVPILLMLIGVAIGGTFWGYQHVASQDPVKIINAVMPDSVDTSKPATPKPPPPGETAESGHWHGEEWHAEPHDTPQAAEAGSIAADTENSPDDVWYPEDYTEADRQADLLGLPAAPGEEYHRRAYKYAVNSYIQKHRQKYPDCTEHAAVLADAKRQAEWILADEKHVDKRRIHAAELDFIMSLYDDFREKYADTLFAGKKLSPADARVAESEKQAILKHLDAYDEQAKLLKREKPISPKPMHTH